MSTTGSVENTKRTITGVVSSHKADKTIIVSVERRVKHKRYAKVVKRTTKYYAHDEENQAKEGDKVVISSARPLSKLKRWQLVEVIQQARD